MLASSELGKGWGGRYHKKWDNFFSTGLASWTFHHGLTLRLTVELVELIEGCGLGLL